MHQPHTPAFDRLSIQHQIKDMSPQGFVGLDDEIHINTQTSSQWDSLKHVCKRYAKSPELTFKGGFRAYAKCIAVQHPETCSFLQRLDYERSIGDTTKWNT